MTGRCRVELGEGTGEGVCCWRETWRDYDRCIWHAEATGKPASELQEARAAEGEVLDCAYLPGVQFGADISFENCSLREAVLSDAMLSGISFRHATLDRATLTGANLAHATLQSASLSHVRLSNADCSHADLRGVDLSHAVAEHVDFSHARLANAEASHANLENATFANADLSETILNDASIADATIENADLRYASLVGADVENAMLARSDLRCVSFEGSRLYGTTFADSRIDHETSFDTLCVYEHQHATETPDTDDTDRVSPMDKAIWTYRALQSLSRDNALREQASHYFVREHDARRRKAWADRDYLSGVKAEGARWIMGYGDRPWQVTYASLVVILASSLLYPLSALGGLRTDGELLSYTSGPSPLWSPQGLAHIVRALAESLYFSVITFTTTGYGTTVAVGYTKIVAMAEALFGVFLTALFVFVLARKVTQ